MVGEPAWDRRSQGVKHLANGLLQQGPTAELHSQPPQLLGNDLVLRRAKRPVDLAPAAGQSLGGCGYVVLRHVEVVAVVDLAGNTLDGHEDLDGAGNVRCMDLLAAATALDRLALGNRLHQPEPFAVLSRPGQAIDARWTQGTDWITTPPSLAVDELFDGRLVGAVVT